MLRHPILTLCLGLCSCLDAQLTDELNWPDGTAPQDGGASADAPPGDGDRSLRLADGEDGGSPGPWDGAGPGDSSNDGEAPWFVSAVGCVLSETTVGALCLSAGPRGIALRFWTSEPVNASTLLSPSGERTHSEGYATEHHLSLRPLTPDQAVTISVEIENVASWTTSEGPHETRTLPLVQPIVINEVLFDPLGPEPQQEFIELFNYGEEPIWLEGWTIADEASEDVIGASPPLPAGGYALIVAAGYVPGAGGDPPPGPGAVMLVLDSAIGTAGIRNDGEALSLRDQEGQSVATFPTPARVPRAGTSVERLDPLGPDGDPLNWVANPLGSATPARENATASR